ncbi:MAG: nucleotidyltransferase domain-containing protein [Candidatus Zixiibacteriota bacterium]
METKVTIGESMIFHHYLEKVLGSKIKINTLRALHKFPRKDFTTRELAKFMGASHSGVLKALKDLEEMNVITIGMHGKAHLLRLNEKSFLAKNLLRIFDIEEKTIDQLVQELRRSTKDLTATSIALYGSIVKHVESPRSDIDLLLITENKRGVEEKISVLQKRFSDIFGNSISPYFLTSKEFNEKKNTKFVKDILENHILIQGRKLEDINAD